MSTEMLTGDAQIGTYLQRETERILSAGPSRNLNPRPVVQPDGYSLTEFFPERVMDSEYEVARQQFVARQAAAQRLVKSGAADPAIPMKKS